MAPGAPRPLSDEQLVEVTRIAEDLRDHYEFMVSTNTSLSKPVDLTKIKTDLDRWELMVEDRLYYPRPV